MQVKIIAPKELTVYEAHIYKEQFTEELKGEKADLVEVDMSLVEFFDSSGIGMLISMRAKAHVFKLTNIPERVEKTLKVYGAYDLLCGS